MKTPGERETTTSWRRPRRRRAAQPGATPAPSFVPASRPPPPGHPPLRLRGLPTQEWDLELRNRPRNLISSPPPPPPFYFRYFANPPRKGGGERHRSQILGHTHEQTKCESNFQKQWNINFHHLSLTKMQMYPPPKHTHTHTHKTQAVPLEVLTDNPEPANPEGAGSLRAHFRPRGPAGPTWGGM